MRRSKTNNDGWFWTNLRIYLGRRGQIATSAIVITAILVVYIGREGLIAAKMPVGEVPYVGAEKPRSADPLYQATVAMNAGADELRGQLRKKQPDRGVVSDVVKRIDRQAARVARAFDADRDTLARVDASAGLKRLQQVSTEVKARHASFADAAAAYSIAPHSAARKSEFSAALDALLPSDEPASLSNDAGFRERDAVATPASLSAGIVPAYGAPTTSGAVPSPLSREPEAADLAPTPETRVTPDIQELADELDNDPVKIFAWVKNNIRFEPYHGIRKGANEVLFQRSGSSTDQSALTVALLRASSTPARFVRGVVELPVADVANWLGVNVADGERASATAQILAGGGIPVTKVNANGALSHLRFEHTWVEVYGQADAYRGVNEDLGGKRRWVAIDPSIKRNVLQAPVADFHASLEPDAVEFAADFSSGVEATPDDGFQIVDFAKVQSATLDLHRAAEENFGEDFDEADLGRSTIAKHAYDYLPSSLPTKVRSVIGEFRGVPASLQSRVRIEVSGAHPRSLPSGSQGDAEGSILYEASTADLANTRVTVGYSPVTAEDEEVVDAYHGLLGTPSYGASLVPVLRVGGAVVARGTEGAGVGYVQRFRIVYFSPGFAPEPVENALTVGSLSALALDLGTTRLAALGERAQRSENAAVNPENVFTDRHAGEMFSLMGGSYFLQGDRTNHSLARVAGVSAVRQLSGAIVATGLSVATIAGFPVRVAMAGTTIDVDQDVQSVVSLRGSADDEARYMQISGTAASLAEGQAVVVGKPSSSSETPGPGVSTTTILAEAARIGVPIFSIDSSNSGAIQSLAHPEHVLKEVRATVEAGDSVVIPKRPVAYRGWSGSAYVLQRDGGADYRISGGLNGGLIPWFYDGGQTPADIAIFGTEWVTEYFGGQWSERLGDCMRAPFTGVFAMEFAIWVLSSGGGGAAILAALSGWVFVVVALFFALVFLTLYISLLNQMYRCVFDQDEGWS